MFHQVACRYIKKLRPGDEEKISEQPDIEDEPEEEEEEEEVVEDEPEEEEEEEEVVEDEPEKEQETKDEKTEVGPHCLLFSIFHKICWTPAFKGGPEFEVLYDFQEKETMEVEESKEKKDDVDEEAKDKETDVDEEGKTKDEKESKKESKESKEETKDSDESKKKEEEEMEEDDEEEDIEVNDEEIPAFKVRAENTKKKLSALSENCSLVLPEVGLLTTFAFILEVFAHCRPNASSTP